MNRPVAGLLALALFVTAPGLTGCATNSLRAVSGGEAKPGSGRVIVAATDGNIIKLVVLNESAMPMVVFRDRVTLSTRNGELTRSQGSRGSVYTIAPGASHDLNVRFNVDHLRPGEKVELLMNDAVQIMGNAVKFEPIAFVVDP